MIWIHFENESNYFAEKTVSLISRQRINSQGRKEFPRQKLDPRSIKFPVNRDNEFFRGNASRGFRDALKQKAGLQFPSSTPRDLRKNELLPHNEPL